MLYDNLLLLTRSWLQFFSLFPNASFLCSSEYQT
uniref:Uncharacterized protein n=1 Tax=Arundo donax TaxID=35708 RepID=A0A0A9GJN6_ARUDO